MSNSNMEKLVNDILWSPTPAYRGLQLLKVELYDLRFKTSQTG